MDSIAEEFNDLAMGKNEPAARGQHRERRIIEALTRDVDLGDRFIRQVDSFLATDGTVDRNRLYQAFITLLLDSAVIDEKFNVLLAKITAKFAENGVVLTEEQIENGIKSPFRKIKDRLLKIKNINKPVSQEKSVEFSISGRSITLQDGESVAVGRTAEGLANLEGVINRVVIDNVRVSARHAQITNRGGKLFITDLDSSNGIEINDVRIQVNQEFLLGVDDIIKLADEPLKVTGDLDSKSKIRKQDIDSGAITFETLQKTMSEQELVDRSVELFTHFIRGEFSAIHELGFNFQRHARDLSSEQRLNFFRKVRTSLLADQGFRQLANENEITLRFIAEVESEALAIIEKDYRFIRLHFPRIGAEILTKGQFKEIKLPITNADLSNVDKISREQLFNPDSDFLMEINEQTGQIEKKLGHGTESLDGLISIIIDGKIKPSRTGNEFVGQLIDRTIDASAGPHGPFYIQLSRDTLDKNILEEGVPIEKHEKYIVPNAEIKDALIRGLRLSFEQGLITGDKGEKFVESVISRITTYAELLAET